MRKKYLLTLDLKDDPALIKTYESWHKPKNIWPEITLGIREAGIEKMEIFRWNSRMVMLIEADDNFDIERDLDRLGKLPCQEEWEKMVDSFQQELEGAEEESKWQRMDRIFDLSDCN